MKGTLLITGISQRVGLALAEHSLREGYTVIGTYRTERASIARLHNKGAEVYRADFCNPRDNEQLISAITQRHTTLRAIIHNASEWLPDDAADEDLELGVLERMLRVHVHAPYRLNQALAPLLNNGATPMADIIHFSDYTASTGSAKHIAYAAAKAALENLTLSFAAKLAPTVKVNAIAPALVLFNDHDDAAYRQKTLQKSLLAREGGLAEIIRAVQFLLDSEFITGRVLPVDGGRHLASRR